MSNGLRIAVLVMCIAAAAKANAAATVVFNHTAERIVLATSVDGGESQLELAPGDSRPLFAQRGIVVRLPRRDGASARPADESYPLQPQSVYEIVDDEQGERLLQRREVGATGLASWPQATGPATSAARDARRNVNVDITVKLLVDDDELRPRQLWESELRGRIAAASEVLRAHCGVGLKVIAVGDWISDDAERDFNRSLAEFEQEVSPAPAQVAIGFSSQYELAQGRIHLGGTRGPLHSHILVKERATSVAAPERMELLCHELGHYFGATHSAEPTSVMRPVIGQGVSRVAGSTIRFDAPNTLLMALLGEEIRLRGVRRLGDVLPETRSRMSAIYAQLDPQLPGDGASGHYLSLMASAGGQPLLDDARRIMVQIARAAKLRTHVAETAKLDGDALLNFYVRHAALAAQQVRPENAPRAMLLALGIGLDDETLAAALPSTRVVLSFIEGESDRKARLLFLGAPSVFGKVDLGRQFGRGAFLVALAGSDAGRDAGSVRQIIAAPPGADVELGALAANRAGFLFAHEVLGQRKTLDEVAKSFDVGQRLPPLAELARQLHDVDGGGEPLTLLPAGHFAAAIGQIDAALASRAASR